MPDDRVWHVYVLECDARLYTGVTTEPDRRLREHRSGGARAARFTRAAARVTLRYSIALGERSLALRAERRLKSLTRAEKLALIAAQPDRRALLERLSL